MVVETRFYKLSDVHNAQEWGSIVATLAQGHKLGEKTLERTYLDTFDWGFLTKGLSVCFEEAAEHRVLNVVEEHDIAHPMAQIDIERLPEFANDIPSINKTAAKLRKQARNRRLLMLAKIRSEQIIIGVEDKKGRLRLRLVVEVNFQRHGRRIDDLGCRLRVECQKGFEKEFARTIPRFDGLERTSELAYIHQILERTGRAIGDYSSQMELILDRQMRSDEALKFILLDQYQQIQVNLPGTIDNLDIEFLHDLRVAVRRSRSALSRMKGVIAQTIHDRIAKELAWVGEITTPVRDLDVYLEEFPKYKEQLSLSQQQDIEKLHVFLQRKHIEARRQLVVDLQSARFTKFMQSWKQFLERPLPGRPTAPNALFLLGEVCDKRIWKTYRRVITEGRAITFESPAEALHDLRKTCKKLRYLLEFFSSLYDPSLLSELLKHLKILQDNLGTFQDTDVQSETMHHFSAQMMEEGETNPQVFMAMGVLVENLSKQKSSVRTKFQSCFDDFSSETVEKVMRKLCGYGKKDEEKKIKKKDEN